LLLIFRFFSLHFLLHYEQNENGYRLEKLKDDLNIFLRSLQIFPDFHFILFRLAVFASDFYVSHRC
jgi:hypothetical protein